MNEEKIKSALKDLRWLRRRGAIMQLPAKEYYVFLDAVLAIEQAVEEKRKCI
jgi:hypothetical protein